VHTHLQAPCTYDAPPEACSHTTSGSSGRRARRSVRRAPCQCQRSGGDVGGISDEPNADHHPVVAPVPVDADLFVIVPRLPSALDAQAGARTLAFASMALPPPPSVIGRHMRADNPNGVHTNGGPPRKRLRASAEIPVSSLTCLGVAQAYD
jgi:hypothetical protein